MIFPIYLAEVGTTYSNHKQTTFKSYLNNLSCISGQGRHGQVAPTWSQKLPLILQVFVGRVCDRIGSTFSSF